MLKKKRMDIPKDIAAKALFLSDRTCCVCRIKGKPVQMHHIDENPSNNNISNLTVLCLDCHNETMIKGGFGRKLDAQQIVLYKNDWQDILSKHYKDKTSTYTASNEKNQLNKLLFKLENARDLVRV